MIAENIRRYKEALREAACPDGWTSRAEHDDILASLEGRLEPIQRYGHDGRLLKQATNAEADAIRLRIKRQNRRRKKGKV